MASDTQSIKNLVHSYAELLDSGNFQALGRLFERAAVSVHGSARQAQGAEAVRRMLVGGVRLYNGVPSTKHLVTNLVIELAEDRTSAIARSYYVAFQACEGLSLQPIMAGRWHDRLERQGDEWYFIERVIYPDLVGDIRFHIGGAMQA